MKIHIYYSPLHLVPTLRRDHGYPHIVSLKIKYKSIDNINIIDYNSSKINKQTRNKMDKIIESVEHLNNKAIDLTNLVSEILCHLSDEKYDINKLNEWIYKYKIVGRRKIK